MKTYYYSCTSNSVWVSFDFGEVEADSEQAARSKAIEIMRKQLIRGKELLYDINMNISMDFNGTEVKEIKKPHDFN